MAVNNSTILENVWLNASNDFQQRIPQPTQTSISATVEALFDPMNRQYFNDFMQVLINRIAFTYVRGERWNNKLAVFKGQKINYGSTIQEIAPNWIRAHAYNVSDETLLKLNRPEAEVWYHSQNRQDRYDISISYDDLRTAFVDEYGLNNFIAKVMEVPLNSDEYDEYRIMLQLIAEYDQNFGFYREHVDAITDETSAKNFLKKLREMAGMLEFPSARYNASNVHIPVFAKNSELVLLMTPAVKASIDVDALAVLFNMEKADVQQRIVVVDEFPIPNVQAILTTEDFFVCHDTVYENTNFWNPQTLVNNYYLHHWGIYSVSPFVPAIMFTIEDGTGIDTVTQENTGFTVTVDQDKLFEMYPTLNADNIDDSTNGIAYVTTTNDTTTWHLKVGMKLPLKTELVGALDPVTYENLHVAPDSAKFYVTGKSGNNPVQLNSRTYVDKYGVLHTQKTLNATTVLTVLVQSTYINPSDPGNNIPSSTSIDITMF